MGREVMLRQVCSHQCGVCTSTGAGTWAMTGSEGGRVGVTEGGGATDGEGHRSRQSRTARAAGHPATGSYRYLGSSAGAELTACAGPGAHASPPPQARQHTTMQLRSRLPVTQPHEQQLGLSSRWSRELGFYLGIHNGRIHMSRHSRRQTQLAMTLLRLTACPAAVPVTAPG